MTEQETRKHDGNDENNVNEFDGGNLLVQETERGNQVDQQKVQREPKEPKELKELKEQKTLKDFKEENQKSQIYENHENNENQINTKESLGDFNLHIESLAFASQFDEVEKARKKFSEYSAKQKYNQNYGYSASAVPHRKYRTGGNSDASYGYSQPQNGQLQFHKQPLAPQNLMLDNLPKSAPPASLGGRGSPLGTGIPHQPVGNGMNLGFMPSSGLNSGVGGINGINGLNNGINNGISGINGGLPGLSSGLPGLSSDSQNVWGTPATTSGSDLSSSIASMVSSASSGSTGNSLGMNSSYSLNLLSPVPPADDYGFNFNVALPDFKLGPAGKLGNDNKLIIGDGFQGW